MLFRSSWNEASYCKWCGERLVAAVAEPVEAIEASRADGSSGAVTSAGSVTGDGMIAKDCVKEPLASFTKRCEQTAEFRKRTGSDVRPGLDCIITGETGTGKTYLAVAMAVKAFRAHAVSRIVLTRPAVEAGEKLGFLPGDMQDKVDPYLRPLYDALYEMLGAESVQRNMEKGSIEVAPLAYMRGRTLDEAFIILDEAQNTTPEQIKMFLTRLGNSSKMVITGDITQIDLPDAKRSGLVEAMKVLRNVDDIAIHQFQERDVVRHKLVQDIIAAYEKYQNERRKGKNG